MPGLPIAFYKHAWSDGSQRYTSLAIVQRCGLEQEKNCVSVPVTVKFSARWQFVPVHNATCVARLCTTFHLLQHSKKHQIQCVHPPNYNKQHVPVFRHCVVSCYGAGFLNTEIVMHILSIVLVDVSWVFVHKSLSSNRLACNKPFGLFVKGLYPVWFVENMLTVYELVCG